MIKVKKPLKKDKVEKKESSQEEKQQTLLPEPAPTELAAYSFPPMDYMEITVEMAGSACFQKVGGSITFRTSDPAFMPKTTEKKDIGEAIQKLFDRSEKGVSLLAERIQEGLVVLKDYRDKIEG